MKNIVYLFFVLFSCFSCSEKPITVHLKGQLKGMVPAEVMRYNGTASMIGDSRDILIHTDENGYFDTIIELKKSEYFSISRNTLYLTPGDDLELVITENNQEATFSGIGAEANNYMKKRLFPKGGSFLEAGRYVRADFVRTKVTVDSLAEERRNELAGLKKVSPEFKKMEEARITADVVNSYISYASYRKDVCFDWQAYQRATPEEQEKINEEQQKLRDAHLIAVAPELNRLYKTLTDTLFLNVAVVRDVLSYFGEDQYGWFEGIELPERTKELYEAADKVEALRQAITATTVNDAKDFIAKAKYQDVVTEVRHKADQAGKLVEGQPAIDIMMTDVDGNVKRLSDFRGKVIYMDLWATWCGPCIQESPFFETLSKKYEGKDIVFLPVSTDSRATTWKSYLKVHHKDLQQYISQDQALKDGWCVRYIPRFILIDRDFKIVNAYAPRPSEEGIEDLLNSIL